MTTRQTPYYLYDTDLLDETLASLCREVNKYKNYHVHYAIKANANPLVLERIVKAGLGVDCVSGWEVEAAINAGFHPSKIVFAGVGKNDNEIRLALHNDIFCFNVESIPELEVINDIANRMNKRAAVCLRINPDVGAHTHANITTGLAENKFGIALADTLDVIRQAQSMENILLRGLHFHIGSQILEMDDFQALALRINEIGVEAKEKTATYEELEKKLESLKEEIPELETKVAETQVQVENARTAYSSASPDGTIEAPKGYKDQRKIPETGAPEDHGLVSLWVEMFVLVGALIVLFVKFEEQRDKRRRKA